MQMIDVLKRLAELDADNPNIVKESQQVEECGMGMMPEMGMPMERPSTPATINMTAGSAAELGDLLKDIVSLAGMKDAGPAAVSAAPAVDNTPPAAGTLEPVGGGDDAIGSMRSMIDKLNPMDGDDEGPKEVGAGSDDDDGVSKAQGDLDGDGDHDMNDHNLEKGDGDEEKEEVDEYDNTPSNPNDKNEFDADQFAHQENQPGQGDRMDGDRPKAYADMNEAVADLFAQYKKFVKEN